MEWTIAISIAFFLKNGLKIKGVSESMVEVKNLVKRYGNQLAVNDVSFTVDSGEILGFLGPNGAGNRPR